jgi:hypothetical protein
MIERESKSRNSKKFASKEKKKYLKNKESQERHGKSIIFLPNSNRLNSNPEKRIIIRKAN